MANDPFGSFEDTFEQGISQVTNQVKKQVSDTTSSAATQVTGVAPSDSTGGAATAPTPDGNALNIAPVTDQFNETNTGSQAQDPALTPQQIAGLETASANEQQHKLAETREKLKAHNAQHKRQYFDPTFNPPKKEKPVAQKIEEEKAQAEQMKLQQIEEQKKKDAPIALSRAQRTTEMNRGASG